MASTPEEMRFAIADARERHKGTVELIANIDRQALSLLQLYVTLAGAALSAAGVILLGTASSAYPKALGIGMLGFAVPLVLGAVLCIATIWPADLNLPGRDPDFWIWADEHSTTAEASYRVYLQNLAVKAKKNAELNGRMSNLMLTAKIAGVAAPVLGFFAGVIATQPI